MLPSPTGPHRVGCVELDIPAPTAAGRVPVVVYYPAHRDAPSSGLPPPESPENAERFEALPRLDGPGGVSTDPPSRDDGRLGGLSLEPPVWRTLSSDNTAGAGFGSSSLSHFPEPVTSENV